MSEKINKILQFERAEKRCKHCKKKVVSSFDCENCKSNYHPSCAFQAGVANSQNEVDCCSTGEKSEVGRVKNPQKEQEMDEKKIKNIVEGLFKGYVDPLRKTLKEDMGELKKSVQYISDGFEEQRKAIENVLSEMKQIKEENLFLKRKVDMLENRLNNSEQKEREKNLVVAGVAKQKEKPEITVQRIVATLKVDISDGEILDVYHVNTRDDSPILIKFKNTSAKQKVIKQVKVLKGVKTKECGLVGENRNIYFNDDLTKQNQYLFKKAREYKRDNRLSAAYVANGKIYIKKRVDDTPVRIRSESDLNII